MTEDNSDVGGFAGDGHWPTPRTPGTPMDRQDFRIFRVPMDHPIFAHIFADFLAKLDRVYNH